jgi:ATP-dependent DNA helicase DinG
VIPACSHAIVDEAHQLEDVATQYFGFSVSTYRVEELARDVERLAPAGALADWQKRDPVDKAVTRLRDDARAFFADLTHAHRHDERARGEERIRATPTSLSQASESAAHLTGALDLLEQALVLLRPDGPDDNETNTLNAVSEQVAALVRRAGELRTELRFLLRASETEFVYFVEFRGRGVFLRASPIDVSAIVRELLFDRMRTTVLTSATLTVDGAFGYIRDRLGIRGAAEIRLASEFDFERQTVLYLPPRMPDPRSPDFAGAAGRQIIEILRRTRGRAFVLFTSYATLRAVQAMAEMALDYPILVQGTVPRSLLLKRFRETPHSVLLATSSFWQGVDVVGEALSCVIIDKLPFASPGEPVTAARIEAIRARGGEPFDEYQVPLAILALRQGLGRLIRHRTDRGILTVLDPRLRTKGYGRRFLASLPPAPVVYELDAVSAFLAADLV